MATFTVNTLLLGASIGCYVLTVIFLAMRMLNNIWVVKKFQWEDMMMVIAFVLYTSSLVLMNSTAYCAQDVFPDYWLGARAWNIAFEQCMLFTLFTVKLSIIGSLSRIALPKSIEEIGLVLVAVYTLVWLITLETLFYAYLCTPVSSYWTAPFKNLQCADLSIYSSMETTWDSSSTALIISIATSLAYKAHLPCTRQVILIGLFAVSAFIFAAALVKSHYHDGSLLNVSYWLWCTLELSAAIWIGNWMHIWALFQKFFNCRTFEYSFSHAIQNPISGQIPSAQAPITVINTVWSYLVTHTHTVWSRIVTGIIKVCSRLVAVLKPRRVGNFISHDVEMVDPSISRVRHTTSASRGTTILMHHELMDYLENGPPTPHSQQLKRDEETSPALLYRERYQID